ncbi:hypothetical protein WN55_09826, partial [Dufourea novaeangliae]
LFQADTYPYPGDCQKYWKCDTVLGCILVICDVGYEYNPALLTCVIKAELLPGCIRL